MLHRRFSKRPSSQFDGLTDVTPSSTALAAQMRFNRFDPARQGFIQGDYASLAVQASRSCSCASQPFCLSFHNLLGDDCMLPTRGALTFAAYSVFRMTTLFLQEKGLGALQSGFGQAFTCELRQKENSQPSHKSCWSRWHLQVHAHRLPHRSPVYHVLNSYDPQPHS